MYDGLPMYVRLAYDLTLRTIAPIIPVVSLNDAVIIKQGQGSATRSGFLSDIISTQYNESLATDFAAIASTLLVPGYCQIDIDWNDVLRDATELNGFIALLCKSIFMRSEGTLDSITSESAYCVEDRIVTLGIKKAVFQRTQRQPGDYHLDDVDVVPRRQAPWILDSLRTRGDGSGWMNSNRRVRSDDGFGGIYAQGLEARPVFAVDCSNFDQFEAQQNRWLGEWNVYRALEQFSLAWARSNNCLAEVLQMYLDNVLKFIIRMNEYNRRNVYPGSDCQSK